MRRRILAGMALLLALGGCGSDVSVAAQPAAASGTPSATAAPVAFTATGRPVLDWNAFALRITFAEPPHPGREARAMAMIQLAVRNAVAVAPEGQQPVAVAAAAREVLAALYPGRTVDLDAAVNAVTASAPADGRDAVAAAARAGARAVIASRAGDGADDASTLAADDSPGTWRPTPPLSAPALGPAWGKVTPFTLGRGDRFRPGAPYALTSSAYAKDFAEVVSLGAANSSTRTAEQTEVATFWRATSTQLWNALARALAVGQNLPERRAADLFAELNVAEADAAIAAWDAKYAFRQWRPVTAIRLAADDGNPDTTAVADWLPLVPTPPFPDHVCGHTALAAAAQEVLEKWFGDGPRSDLSLTSPALPGVTRTWPSFGAIVTEVEDARVWGGIHWRTSCARGAELGHQVGEYALDHLPPS